MQKYYHTLLRLWALLKPFHKSFYLQLGLIISIQLIQVFLIFLVSKVIDNIISKSFETSLYLLFVWFFFNTFRLIIDYFKVMNELNRLDLELVQFLEEYSFKNVFRLNPSQYIEDHSAVKYHVIQSGEKAVVAVISTFVLNLIPTFTLLLFSLSAITYYSPVIGLITLVTLVSVLIWTNKFTKYHRPFVKKNIENWTEQTRNRIEGFQHLSLIKTSGVEETFLNRYLSVREKFTEYAKDTTRVRYVHGSRRFMVFNFSRFSNYLYILKLASFGEISVGVIYSLITWINESYGNIFNVIQAIRNVPLQFIEIEKYLDIIDKHPEFSEQGKSKFQYSDIYFKNLSFKYPNSPDYVLKNINLKIPYGNKVAFVGSSGSGKSTIVKLILRIYDYSEGEILLGNENIKNIKASTFRKSIGYVEQHVDLFDTTIRENILFSLGKKSVDEKLMSEVINKSRISEFFHRLGEKGLDTLIGERGVKLSGGERQRIGIARALIKDPEILIFDEATASLDTVNEKLIQEAIDESSKGRTSIIIAHRLSTVQNADKIFVMDHGKLEASGTHAELLETSKIYQKLVQSQFVN